MTAPSRRRCCSSGDTSTGGSAGAAPAGASRLSKSEASTAGKPDARPAARQRSGSSRRTAVTGYRGDRVWSGEHRKTVAAPGSSSPSASRSSCTKRDLPMPGSPTRSTTWPRPAAARRCRSATSAISAARPTNGACAGALSGGLAPHLHRVSATARSAIVSRTRRAAAGPTTTVSGWCPGEQPVGRRCGAAAHAVDVLVPGDDRHAGVDRDAHRQRAGGKPAVASGIASRSSSAARTARWTSSSRAPARPNPAMSESPAAGPGRPPSRSTISVIVRRARVDTSCRSSGSSVAASELPSAKLNATAVTRRRSGAAAIGALAAAGARSASGSGESPPRCSRVVEGAGATGAGSSDGSWRRMRPSSSPSAADGISPSSSSSVRRRSCNVASASACRPLR